MRIFIIIPADYDTPDDIMAVFTDSKEVAWNHYYELEGQSPDLREFVQDRGCNMSLSEKFWCDDKGYMFQAALDFEYNVVARMDIQIKCKFDDDKINKYLDDTYKQNIRDFFKHDPDLGDAFWAFMREETDELPEHIYKYVAQYDEDWREVHIREIEIPHEVAVQAAFFNLGG